MGFRGLPRYEERDGVRITRLPALRKRQATCETHEMASYVASAWPWVAQRLRKNAYDIVHLHFIIPTGLVAYLAARRRHGVPYVVTARTAVTPLGYNPDRFQCGAPLYQAGLAAHHGPCGPGDLAVGIPQGF